MAQTRRNFLLGLAAVLAAPRQAIAAAPSATLAAAWQAGRDNRVGLLAAVEAGLAIAAQLDVPTRAHGLLAEPSGTLLAVARRPGDWLLRWDRQGRALAWRWIESGRAFAGHLLASPDGATVYSTEIDLETGAGLIGVRDAASLEKRAEWPTHGLDPHQLILDRTRAGSLIVANGGVPTRPETGRLKVDLDRMASSLVRLDATTGALLGQWRLADPRLSLRHLAWNGDRLGIALQAEHDDPAAKAAAPILAVLADDRLEAVPGPDLAGYGGAIAPLGDGFAIGCPRAQGVALYGRAGYRGRVELAEACPLATVDGRLWAGGRDRVLNLAAGTAGLVPDIRLDNHWIAL